MCNNCFPGCLTRYLDLGLENLNYLFCGKHIAQSIGRGNITTIIQHNTVLIHILIAQKREREELDRQLQAGLQEEERFKKLVDELIKGTVRAGVKHPFRGVLERYDCHCPKESHTGPILI